MRRERLRCPNFGHPTTSPSLNALDLELAHALNLPMEISNGKASAKVRRLIVDTLPEAVRGNPRIFGAGASLDSLGLVNFIADLEYRLAEEFGREIVIASERAMSRTRSPFRDIDSLTDYVAELLAE
jgi:hypothetical protein